MKSIIELATWKRKVHFEFFNQFDDPSFEMTSKVDSIQANHALIDGYHIGKYLETFQHRLDA